MAPVDVTELDKIVKSDVDANDETAVKEKEQAILTLGEHFATNNDGAELRNLISAIRPFLQQVSKAKAGKLVRRLIDLFLDLDDKTTCGEEVIVCRECIDWAQKERRVFLRQALEAKLIGLYYRHAQYEEALALGTTLLRELKKLDDKALFVEVELLESKVYYKLGNLQKSRAALTSARTTANGIFCPPKLQAALDMQSGVLHAADERDFKTAYSYFYESFEGYHSIEHRLAVDSLKYMLMCKIMLNSADEVPGILSSKLAVKYSGEEIDSMRDIALAAHNRSLADYSKVLETHKEWLTRDPVISKHLYTLYDTLLGQNLEKLTEPYSRVQIEHVAKLINLPKATVEKKLSLMILDKKLKGFLDQGSGVLVLLDEQVADQGYKTAIETLHGLSRVVDQLYVKAKNLT